MQEEELIPVFVPSLAATLLNQERQKGSPLTQDEVLYIRDSAPVIATPKSVVPALDERRGYIDINPAFAWEEWQELRKEFKDADTDDNNQ